MKNWKIGTRIMAGFAVVILIAAALGIFAYLKLGSIDGDAKRITQKSLPKSYLVSQIQKNVQMNFGLLLQHVSVTDQREKAKLEAEVEALRTANSAALGDYEKLV